jgi:hypothetical protein
MKAAAAMPVLPAKQANKQFWFRPVKGPVDVKNYKPGLARNMFASSN